jgi:hypothetical protein
VQFITLHDVRHSCASLAVSAGVNMLTLQRMLGHTSEKITLDTYADLFDDDLDAVPPLCIAAIHVKVRPKCGHRTPETRASKHGDGR